MQINNVNLKASMMESYMRQSEMFHLLRLRVLEGKISHGYLFYGAKGTGKHTLAQLFSQMLFCSGENIPCGQCSGCQKIVHHNHSDMEIIRTEKTTIGVAQIRQSVLKAGEYAYEGGYRVILIEQGDKMTVQAQNALLKTLEEPHEKVVFLLLAQEKNLLLPTVLSRVQTFSMPQASLEEIGHGLKMTDIPFGEGKKIAYLAQGRLGAAVDYALDKTFIQKRQEILADVLGVKDYQGIITFSTKWKDQKDQSDQLLSFMEELIRICLLVTLQSYPQEAIADYPLPWRKMAGEPESTFFLLKLLDRLLESKRKKASQVNWQGILEEILIDILEENKKWQP